MQVTNITSEALQATIRRLLPSQQGFGEDLQASNVIIPIVDLTASAEGSELPTNLAQALSFDVTSFDVSNQTSTIVSNTGFYRVFGSAWIQQPGSGGNRSANFSITDGLTTKKILETEVEASSAANGSVYTFDFIVCLGNGESLTATTSSTALYLQGSTRQVADINGNLVNPTAYVSQ